MGISGLFGLLKSIQKPCNVKKFNGQTLGVDAYGWLHRGTIACAIDLALDRHTTKYVDFAMDRVRMLLYYGVTPYIVFDGGRLPSKDSTEDTRAARRERSKALGLELYRTGRVTQARQEFQKAIDVTPYMARLFIEELKSLNVQYVVAPYEADAQLVYLEKEGIINGIISEDSDMLVFGAKVLLSKLDKHGDCIEINRNDFTACRDISLVGWTDEQFRHMCILSGCDYLPNIPKLGLKTAYQSLRKYKTVEKVVKMVQFEGQTRVPPDYLEGFKRAELTFIHQRVFCPKARKLVTLTPLVNDAHEKLTFIGDDIEPDIAIGIACGDLDPITKEPIHIKPRFRERSRMVISRRQTLPLSGEKRKPQPISNFFTPKRVPLGELDPNSLTPSPSQQALLIQNSDRSWLARRAPASPYLSGTSSTNQTPIRTQRTERETFLSRAGTLARTLPIKRQRLCSDAADSQPGTFTEHSRFFPTNTVARNGASKRPQLKKPKKADFGVFSNDSIEGIMCQIHDNTGTTATTSPQNQVKAESAAPSSERVPGEKHTVTSPSVTNPNPGKELSQISSKTHSAQAKTEDAKDVSETLGTRFAYKLGQGTDVAADANAEFRVKQSTSRGVTREHTATCAQLGKQSRRIRMSPLQRLQQTAMGRSKSMNFVDMEMANRGPDEPGYESDYSAVKSTLASIDPSSLRPKGSEDLIIPSTDDSDDGSFSSTGKPHSFGSLDLKKFRFSSS